jgi:hypothetical protein
MIRDSRLSHEVVQRAIMWQSSKQRPVTTSTTEAELLSPSHTAKEKIVYTGCFQQIQFDPEHQPVLILKDRPQLISKLNFWLRQIHQDGEVAVQWVPTTDMPLDGFTNPLCAN